MMLWILILISVVQLVLYSVMWVLVHHVVLYCQAFSQKPRRYLETWKGQVQGLLQPVLERFRKTQTMKQ